MELQSLVLRSLLSKEAWEGVGQVMNPEVINDPAYKKLYDIMDRLHGITQQDLTLSAVEADITTTYSTNTNLKDDLMDRVKLMKGEEVVPPDQLWELVRNYMAKEQMEKAVNWGIAHMNDPEPNLEEFLDMVTKARDVSIKTDTQVTSLLDYAAPDENVREGVIPLGWNTELDRALGGGIAKRELAAIMGAGGRGKTSHMIKTGANASMMNYNTLAISLEINEGKYMMSFDRAFSGMSKQELLAAPQRAVARRKEKMQGEVWFKDWSHEEATVSDIEALLQALIRQDKRVDLLIIDYWTILKPRLHYKDERRGFREIGLDLRRLANKYNVAVLTGWQANRAGAVAETLDETHIGEDYTVMWTSDTIITLNQNKEENHNKRMRYGILKQREGTNRSQFLSYCDLDRMIMRDETAADLAKKFNLEVRDVRVDGKAEEISAGATGSVIKGPIDSPA